MKKRRKLTETELRYLSEAILNEKKKVDDYTSSLLYAYTGELYNLSKTIRSLAEALSKMGYRYDFGNIYDAISYEIPNADKLFKNLIRR